MIEVVREITDELHEALKRLVPQLSRSARQLSRHELETLVASESVHLLIARDKEGRVVGTLTLAIFRIPTGVRAWIEDVIVDSEARGQGVGAALTETALEIARVTGARTVDLTSRPSREAANHLYQRLGFEQRDTHVYRYTL